MALVLQTAPASEPLSLSDAKDQLKVDTNASDAIISSFITAAREYAETFTRRALITQTWKLYLDEFPKVIRLTRSPVQSVTSIEYEDVNGNTQTAATSDYRVDTNSEPARITEADGESWPLENHVTNAVIVTFDAGYGDGPDDVPEPIKAAMKLHVELLHYRPAPDYAEALERSRDSLLWPYRVISL